MTYNIRFVVLKQITCKQADNNGSDFKNSAGQMTETITGLEIKKII